VRKLLQKAAILPLIGIAVTLAIILSPLLVFAEEDAEERELLLVECLAERAERGELTVRQLYEALGRPLSAVPTEVWDNKVFGGPVERVEVREARRVETDKPFGIDYPAAVPAGVRVFLGWSYIYRIGQATIEHGSVTWASASTLHLEATSELRGPTGNSAHDWELFSTRVEAWDLAPNRAWGLYRTKGTHSYWDPFLDPMSSTWYSSSRTILVPRH